MLMWVQKRGEVDFTDDVVSSTIIFYFERDDVRFSVSDTQDGTPEKSSQESSQKILELITANTRITTQELAESIRVSRRAVAKKYCKVAK